MLSPAIYTTIKIHSSTLNQSSYNKNHSQKTSKQNNQKHWSTSPKICKQKAESHIFPVGPTSRFHCWDRFRLRTRLYLCHGVFSRVFGFIMAVIIVGGKKGSNGLRFGGAIFQILLLLRPEAGKLRSYSTKMKKIQDSQLKTCDCINTYSNDEW